MAFDIFRLAGRVVLNSADAISGLRNIRSSSRRTSESMEELIRRFYENERRMDHMGDSSDELEDDLESLRNEMNHLNDNSMTFNQRLQNIGRTISNVGSSVKNAGRSMSMFITAPILTGIAGAIKQASDMNETISKTQVVFKDGANEVLKWSDHTLKSVGLAKGTSLDMAATFGDMGTAMGLNSKEAKKMAMGLVDLTGDMASFKNMKPDEIHIALAGAYTGETEALKRLGIVMTVANLERFAAAKGIKKGYKEMTESERIQLRYNYIMDASKNSVGDFKRTQKGAANQMRIFTEGIKETGAKIGTIFLPYFTKAVTFVNGLLDKFRNLSPTMQKVGVIIALVVAAIGPLLIVLGSLITFVGGVVTAIGTIGLPVLAVIAALLPLIAIFGGIIGVIGAAIYKTGILQKAFHYLRDMFNAIILILRGDVRKGFAILVGKLGMSSKQALDFIKKIKAAQKAIKKLINFAKDVGELIKAIFSGDKQKVIDLLIKKFGMSKKGAKEFWDKIVTLKKEILKFAKRVKEDGIEALKFFADKIKTVSKWVIDHRKQIAGVIKIVIQMATAVVKSMKRAYDAAKFMIRFGLSVRNAMKTAYNAVRSLIGKMIGKLTGFAKNAWRWGYNAIKAFGKGIASAYGWVKDKVKSIAGLVSKFLGFHSPTEEGPGKDADTWGPNFMKMLAEGIESKKTLIRDTMQKVAGELDIRGKVNDFAIGSKGQNGQQVILQINNPKFFNQQDVSKMMDPVIKRLEFMGFGSR